MAYPGHVFLWTLCLLCLYVKGEEQLQEHLKPLGSFPPEQNIATLDSIPTPKYFYEWFVKPGQPVLLKSVLYNPKYNLPAFKLWTDDYLSKKYGNTTITYEHHKKETRDEKDYKEMKLQKFLKTYKQADVYMVLDLNILPKLKEDVYVPPMLKCGGARDEIVMHNVWFSSGGTKSVLHRDSLDNINCLLEGTKDILFFHDKYAEAIETEGYEVERSYHKVDVDKVDLNKFPQFKSVRYVKGQMQKGDCLFIPYTWYHQVNSFQSRNVAVNIWFEHPLWFNETDCKMNGNSADIPLSKIVVMRDPVRGLFMNEFAGYPRVYKEHMLFLVESGEDVDEIFEFIDADMNGVVSMEELNKLDLKEFIEKFKSVLSKDFMNSLKTTLKMSAQMYDVSEIEKRYNLKTEL